MNYYLDYDTRLKKYFIIPYSQNIDFKFMVEFTIRSEAEAFLKRINSGLIESPIANFNRYEEIDSKPVEIEHYRILKLKK